MPGASTSLGGHAIRVGHPVLLPDAYASEPVITITPGGVVGVTAPGGGGNGPRLLTEGGFVWTSPDGEAYDLVLDPRPRGAEQPLPAGSCSCDTDIVALGDELVVATMYWTTQPLFNTNIVASADAGQTWETRSALAALAGPVDRPWLAADGDLLFLVYNGGLRVPVDGLPEGLLTTNLYMQSSADGGRTWQVPRLLGATQAVTTGYLPSKPFAAAGRLVVPAVLQDVDADPPWQNRLFLIGDDEVATVDVGAPYRSVSAFDLSVHGQGDLAVAAWTVLDAQHRPSLLLSHSRDAAQHWDEPVEVALGTGVLQPWVAVGDGVVAVAFYASATHDAMDDIAAHTAWWPEVVLLEPDAAQPFARIRLSAEPVLLGNPCNLGSFCPVSSTRSPLREFLSAAWAEDGTLLVAYTDAEPVQGDQGLIGVGSVQVLRA